MLKRAHWLLMLTVGLTAASCSCWLCGGSELGVGPQKTDPAATLATSLHGTGGGMKWWYEQDDGLGPYTGVPWEDTGCGACHVSTCDGCHEDGAGSQPAVMPDACKECHGRIKTESDLQLADVHFDKGMLCSECHSSEDMHGDGKRYNSMLSPGAMDAKCENCHGEISDNVEHERHGADFNCDACHIRTVITCYNCHFQTLLEAHEKKAAGAFKDYIILLNDDNGKIRAGTYQSVAYGDKTFVAFGPYHGHTVTPKGRTCNDCHNSERMLELRDTGKVVMTRWDADAGKVKHTTGVIPFVPDKLQFQFVTLDGGAWVPLSTETGRSQYKFCSPLTEKQLKALGGMDRPMARP